MAVTRRGLLIGAAAGGGLLAAWALLPRDYGNPLPAEKDETAFNAWLRLGKDGVVTVAIPALEMGQGIATLIAQVVAVELGADWRQVALAPAPLSPAYADPVLAERWAPYWLPAGEKAGDTLARRYAENGPLVITAEGTALAAYEGPAREAAAAVRAMLAQAAADKWGAAWEECEAVNGFIVHEKQRLPFAALIEAALDFAPPDPPVLRAGPAAEKAAAFPDGAPPQFPRLDLPAKVDGSYTFAGDVRLPGMVYAAVAHGPLGDTVLAKIDRAAAQKVTGLVEVIESQRWVAAVATNWFAADKAVQALNPLWKAQGKVADSSRIEERMDNAVRKGTSRRVLDIGDADALLEKPRIALRYDVDPAFHAAVETASAAARLRDGKLELWIAAQAPDHARRAAAEAAGIGADDVVLYPMAAGGSFDTRLDSLIAAEAATIAVKLNKPVMVTWSRWQELLASFPRAPAAAILAAATDGEGRLLGLKTRIAAPASAREALGRLLHGKDPVEALADSAGEADPFAVEGAVPPYAIPDFALEHVAVELPLPTARYRGNAHGYTAFFTECFIDELAVLAKREPMSYRIAMLGQDARLAACLTGAARLAEWDGGRDASGQGIACHRMEIAGRTGRIAVVATARRDELGMRVDRISAYADLGRIVNVDIARQQIEGGLVFGLAMAIGGAASYASGVPLTGRLGELGLPLLADCPEIVTAFAESDDPPFDPGEIGAVAVAPAIANALYSATGLRFRRLPLLSDGL
jgi:isoquinoline 1-oxidoreductase beta subunit